MSLHRIALFGLAVTFVAGMTSVASACCGGCGGCGAPSAAIVYAQPVAPPPPPPLPVPVPLSAGCGCHAPVAYVPPLAPPPPLPPPAPVVWSGGCGCHPPAVYAYPAPAAVPTPIEPAPIYVVNQGPDYTGPGIMVPYRTWTQEPTFAPPAAYPYVPGYGYGYGRRAGGLRIAYGGRFYGHPRVYGPVRRAGYWHR
jgi:hypothetical protein